MADVSVSVPKAPFVVLRGPLRDMANLLAHRGPAPKAQERIWINPTQLTRIYTRNPATTPDFKRRHSGMIIDGDWDRHVEPIDTSWKISACLKRFRLEKSWQATGVVDRMRDMIRDRGIFDSCRTDADIAARYAKIDALYRDIADQGFRNDTILRWGVPRLPEGVFVHIDRDGDPIFGAIGNHRMGIARALGLRRIPAQLGVVHPDAVSQNALERYREGAV